MRSGALMWTTIGLPIPIDGIRGHRRPQFLDRFRLNDDVTVHQKDIGEPAVPDANVATRAGAIVARQLLNPDRR
jgi:hypothetical protein